MAQAYATGAYPFPSCHLVANLLPQQSSNEAPAGASTLFACLLVSSAPNRPSAHKPVRFVAGKVVVWLSTCIRCSIQRIKVWCAVNQEEQPEQLADDDRRMADMLVEHVQHFLANLFGVSAGRQALLAALNAGMNISGAAWRRLVAVVPFQQIAQ